MFGCSGIENAGLWFICHPLHRKKQVDSNKPLPVWTNRAPQKFRQSNHTFCVKAGESVLISLLVICWAAQKRAPVYKEICSEAIFFRILQSTTDFIKLNFVHTSSVVEFFTGETTVSSSFLDCFCHHLWTVPTQILFLLQMLALFQLVGVDTEFLEPEKVEGISQQQKTRRFLHFTTVQDLQDSMGLLSTAVGDQWETLSMP